MNLWRNDQGSYTLEATIAVPVFLAILIFLINIINVAMVYVAMDHAVSETAKLVAAYSYPLKKIGSRPDSSGSDTSSGDVSGNKVAGNDIAAQLITSIKKKGSSILLDLAVKEIIKKKITDFYPLGNLDDHSFFLSQVKIINPRTDEPKENEVQQVNGIRLNSEDIAIVAVYTVKLPVPFLPMREITLSNTAVERAWTDG